MISVILPTYNSVKTLKRSVNSVINQQGSFKIELIIINDCSKDGTKKYLESLNNKDRISFIKINNEKNFGVGFCRRLGIMKANGEFIAFIDADDYWLDDKLICQLDTLRNNPEFKICFSNYLIELNNEKFYLVKKRKIITSSTNKYINEIPLSTAIINSKLAKEFDYPSIRIRNDYIFWNNILKSSKKISAINCETNKPLAVYGKKKGISSNKLKIIYYQWILYRRYFKYNIFSSVYGIFSNILVKVFRKKEYYKKR